MSTRHQNIIENFISSRLVGISRIAIGFLLISLISNTSWAQTWTSQTDGNWEDNGTWSNADDIADYGAGGTDLAIINDTVTINGNFTFGWRDDLTINSGGLLIVEGDLTFDSWFADIAVNAGGGLIVDGDLNMEDKADFNVDGLVVVLEDMNINIDGDGDLEDLDGQIYVIGESTVTNCPGCSFSPEDEGTLATDDPEFLETVNETQGTTLPVELVSFTGKAETSLISLSWSTATEINNDYFVIQRSVDGKYFEDIGTVKGNGNYTGILEYQFIDYNYPAQNLVYYRLHQFDFDGQNEILPTIAVQPLIQNIFTANVFPNPVAGASFKVSVEGSDLESVVDVIDMKGQLMYSGNIESTNRILEIQKSSVGLKPGLYILRIRNGENTVIKRLKIN